MKQILIATTNPGKLTEIKYFLDDLPLELLSLSDCRDTMHCVSTDADEPIEDGATFKENAIIKAKYYSQKTGLPTISDDGGIEIDYFNGEPGVKSKRWINGKVTSDRELINYTLKKMKSVPQEKRGAQLRTVLAFALPDGRVFTREGKIRGIVAKKSGKYTPGYPYRAIFFIPQVQKYYDPKELTKEEYESVGHRGKALKKLKEIIKAELL